MSTSYNASASSSTSSMDQTLDASTSASSSHPPCSWNSDDDEFTSFGELPPMDLDESPCYDPALYQQAVDEFVRQMAQSADGDCYEPAYSDSDSGSDSGMSSCSSASSVESFDELIERFDGLPNEVIAEFVKTCCASCPAAPEDQQMEDFDFEALLSSLPTHPLSSPSDKTAMVSVSN